MTKTFLLVFALLALPACSTVEKYTSDLKEGVSSMFGEEEEESLPETAEGLHQEGRLALNGRAWERAAKMFEELERRHPFSPLALQAQLNAIYAHFKDKKYDEAVSASERFIRLHPRHAHVAYAFYMRGLSHYRRITDAFRDQQQTREATAAFREVVTRFPQSDYAADAEQMLLLCRDRLVEHEMVVGRYYLDRREYIAAINRFRLVVENPDYNRTPYVDEALVNLTFASLKLGLPREARNYAAVLGHNDPDGRYYAVARELVEGQGQLTEGELAGLRRGVVEGSWVNRFLDGIRPGMPDLSDF